MDAKITSVESSGKRSERSKKTLDHIEIHPKMGGGQIVKHIYNGYSHEPDEHSFTQKEGDKFAAHVSKHTGVPLKYGKASETEEEIENEGGE